MKRIITAIALSSILALPAAWADDNDDSAVTSSKAAKTGMPCLLSKLLDAKVVSKANEDLGELEDIIINPQTGKIDYAILGRGGFLGIGEKMVPVPWKAFSVNTGEELTLNVDKEKLKTAPTTDKSYAELNNPGYTVTIYEFYAIPVEAGGAETPNGTEAGQSQSDNSSSSTTPNPDSSTR